MPLKDKIKRPINASKSFLVITSFLVIVLPFIGYLIGRQECAGTALLPFLNFAVKKPEPEEEIDFSYAEVIFKGENNLLVRPMLTEKCLNQPAINVLTDDLTLVFVEYKIEGETDDSQYAVYKDEQGNEFKIAKKQGSLDDVKEGDIVSMEVKKNNKGEYFAFLIEVKYGF